MIIHYGNHRQSAKVQIPIEAKLDAKVSPVIFFAKKLKTMSECVVKC